ncbi:MAG: hypothetical protein HY906_22725 [Deltaproteobacteria bacterium]|nr:hypothetical protein [Deltaproteobacteria bacterium]
MGGRLGVLVVVVAALGCGSRAAHQDVADGGQVADAAPQWDAAPQCVEALEVCEGPAGTCCDTGYGCCAVAKFVDMWGCVRAGDGGCPTNVCTSFQFCPEDSWCTWSAPLPVAPSNNCSSSGYGGGVVDCKDDCPAEARCGDECCGANMRCGTLNGGYPCCMVGFADAGTDGPPDAAPADGPADAGPD